MSDSCIFCKILRKEIPSTVVLETENVLVFRDIDPKAPIHLLAVPKKHIPTINDLTPEDWPLLGQIFDACRQAAQAEGIAESGYRLVANVNRDGGQEVFHIHVHLLGGKRLGWPKL